MFKLQLNWLGRTMSRAGIVKLGSVMLLGLAATTTSWAAPLNDNFTNATVITGNTGSANGSNVGATSEPGEPVDAGNGGGKSIWYVWTAPFTGTVQFNTEGSDFDTVMGAYTGTSVSNLAVLAQNDDVVFPSDLTSQISFPVLAGTNYYISVDGNEGDSGNVGLAWRATGDYSAGQFSFATATAANANAGGFPLYIVGADDDTPSHIANWMQPIATHARVVRTLGTAGMVHISYTVTNTSYTNVFITNLFGTNLLTTNLADGSFTNILSTNVYSVNHIQNFVNGNFTTCLYTNAYVVMVTNVGLPRFSFPPVTTQLAITNGLPPAICTNGFSNGSTTNGTAVFFSVTNVFCLPAVSVTNIVPSATPNTDYLQSTGTVTMVDYQMGVDIPYIVLNPVTNHFSTNINQTNLVNHLVVLRMTSVTLDSVETNLNLAPPVLLTTNAYAQILNKSVPYYDPCNFTNASFTTAAGSLANFIQSVNWMDEFPSYNDAVNVTVQDGLDPSTQRVARVYLRRSGTDFTGSLTVNYVADQISPTTPLQQNALHSPAQNPTFPLQPGSDYATPPGSNPGSREPTRFSLATGTVTWGANDGQDKFIDITINNNPAVQFNEDILVQIWNPLTSENIQPGIGQLNTATVTIFFNDQPAGSVDRNHNPNNVQSTNPPFNTNPGAGGSNNTVYAAVIQPDNKTVFSGDFRAYNGTLRNRLARMNADGSLDTGFLASPNSGANDTISCIALQPDGQVIIGGVFTSFNSTNRFHVARLNSDGSLDASFNTGVGVNGSVWALSLQPDGKVIVGGNFTSVNSTNRNYIARLNIDGSLDTGFSPGVGPNATVNAIALQGDGKIVIGGQFTTIDNTNFSSIARLNADGTLDTSFNPGLGGNQPIYALAEQPDGKVVVGGAFSTINLTSRNGVARLNGDGSIDLGFDPGTGANDIVYTVALQPDGNIMVGGLFTSFNGTRRVGVARLLANGPVDTSFLDTAYNQFAGLINTVHNQVVQPKNYLFTVAVQADGGVIIGGRFGQLGGGADATIGRGVTKRDAVSPRLNIARLNGGSTPGPGNVGLSYSSYSADKANQTYYITMVRANGALGAASATLEPNPLHNGGGNAIPGVDYTQAAVTPVWPSTYPGTWMASDAWSGPNNQATNVIGSFLIGDLSGARLAIFDNLNSSGNLGLNLQLSQPLGTLTLGGEPIPVGVALGNAEARLTIVDDSVPAGTLGFSVTNFFVNESGVNATITVIRTNGSTGPITVQYQTTPGTALPGSTNDYIAVSGTLNFNSGEISKTFTVPIVDNFVVRTNDRSLMVSLTNVTGGGILGANSSATLTIINDNFTPGKLNFNPTNYAAHENAGLATISVARSGGSQGTVSISFSTSDGSAVSGSDYLGTNGTLTWNSGDTAVKTFTIPLINSGLVNSNTTVNLQLSNPIVNGSPNANGLGAAATATLTIINDNFFGSPTLSAGSYSVNENAGVAVITVNRLGGSAQTITVDYATSDGTAQGGPDYTPVNGTLTFTNGQFSQSINIPINNNSPQTYDGVYFAVTLSNPTPVSGPGGGVVLGNPSTANVTIIANELNNEPPGSPDTTFDANAGFNATVYCLQLQSNGSLLAGGDFTQANNVLRNRIARLNPNGSLDVKFSSGTGGANGSVRALALQTDGQILVGGIFTAINNVNQNYVARLNYDGSLDSTFDTGVGADNPVYAVAETFSAGGFTNANRKIIIGGSFSSINGIPYRSVAQLNQDGSVDTTFNAAGANGTVYAVAVYSTNDVNVGKILIAGDFTTVNGTNVNHIARLNADGTLDATFNSFNLTTGPNDSVRTLAIQVDGKVVIGGLFTSVNGQSMNYIARLDSVGQLDANFNVGVGANDAVTALAVQQDLSIMVGGSFTQASGVTRNRLTRLHADGTVDAGINFGLGANDFVTAVVVQPDARLVIGGGFTQFNGVSKPHIARLYGGSETGEGTVEFVSANFQVNENVTNIVIGVHRLGGTGDNGPGGYTGSVSVLATTSDGTGINGTDYIGSTNLLTFGPGETFQSFSVPILNNSANSGQATVNLTLSNPVNGDPSTFAQLGNQSTALLTIIGANSTMSFSTASYTVNKNAVGGSAVITVVRNNSSIGVASIDFYTTSTGTATPVTDYTPVTNTLSFTNGQTSQTVSIPIANNGLPEGNQTVGLALINPTNTVLDTSLPTTAILTIVDNSLAPGNLGFSAPTYTVSETGTNAVITIVRTNGSVGQVSVHYTASGGTAVVGLDYASTSGTLTFVDGQISKSFVVPIINDLNLTNDVTVNLTLSQPTGGSLIVGPPTVPLTIINQNLDVSFAQNGYFVDEKNGNITIGVKRFGGTNGTVFVNYATADGTAVAGVNYITTSGTLTFSPGQTFQSFITPIVYDPQITGNLVFFVNLSKPNGSSVQLISPITDTVTVLDDDSGFSLASATNSIIKAGTNAIITVFRTGNTAGSASINFATSGGSALANVEYVPTNGVLNFLNGINSNSFVVTILNDNQIDGDQTVNLTLSNPTAGTQLLQPSTGVLTIIDNESGFSFSSSAYTVNENGVFATVTVNRTGVTNNTASINYAATDGTAHTGSQYQTVSGTLIFTNGQTTATFNVPIIDNNVTGGSETVLLLLSNPSSTATLANPSAATLTILNNDGSLIVPAGSALLNPTNGVINPGASVTVLLSLLNAAGSDATNLTATLLATNGVIPSGTVTQNYGTLFVGGPSVFRPFTFSTGATNTNGTIINAVLQLHYGTNVNSVSFRYALGTTTNYFTNSARITINDLAAANPYPSSITITSLVGVVSKVTATVSNLGHAYASDISMLLVGPAGQKELLLEQTGGQYVVTNITLTFDSTVTNRLTSSALTSGTYQPSPLQTGITFHPSTNNVSPPPAPYGTNLSDFINTNPNGTWSLYVDDSKPLDAGSINNGWSLAISTLSVVTPNVDLTVGLSASPASVVVNSNLTYTIAVTNAGPSAATGILLTNVLPTGASLVSVTHSQGTHITNSGTVICNLGTLATNGTATVTIVVAPTIIGSITNTVSAFANEAEDNLPNNSASVITTVIPANADLGITVADSPDPVLISNYLTYTITVTNLGPATASGVFVTNTVPAGVKLITTNTPGGFTNASGFLTFSLGTMGSGASQAFTVVVQPTIGGVLLSNSFGVGSSVPDPLKGNNTATVKTVVQFVPLNISHSGNSLTFSWPVSVGSYGVQSATNLAPPVTWTAVTNIAVVANGTNTVTVPVSTGTKFFRLSGH